jgi:hypothetical protein
MKTTTARFTIVTVSTERIQQVHQLRLQLHHLGFFEKAEELKETELSMHYQLGIHNAMKEADYE